MQILNWLSSRNVSVKMGAFCVLSVFNTLLVTVLVGAAPEETTTILTTRAGRFKGSVRKVDVFGETKTVERYFGIPYAETPKRFQKAAVKAPMDANKLYDATSFKPSCSQLEVPLYGERKLGMKIETSENCLFLNIYKPSGESEIPSAVMVHIHGGGFVTGSPQAFPGDMLCAFGDVIFITVAYRLAVLGFLSTGDRTLPGNLGLWDQHTALIWIHENIAAFGGDPQRVTLLGHSAGSSSVVYQSLFPMNRGLFQRAIGLSGSITCPWSFQPNPLEQILRFARLIGCPTDDLTNKMIQCIESKSTEEIESTLNNPAYGYIKFPMEMVTTVDGEFLQSDPYRIISHDSVISRETKEFFTSVDFMTGITIGEGALNIHPFAGVMNTFDFAPSREEFEHKLVPEAAKIMFGDNIPNVVADMIIHKYTNWSNPNDINSPRQSFVDMSGDYVFNFHAKLLADMHANLSSAKESSTYAYRVEALPSQHILEIPSWISKPTHGDELSFLLGYDREGWLEWTTPYSENFRPAQWELETSKLMMTLFTNFAKTGDPNKPVRTEQMKRIVWPKYDAQSGQYLAIEQSMSENSVRKHFGEESFNFWYELLPKVISTASQDSTGSSYFKSLRQEACDSDEHCPP